MNKIAVVTGGGSGIGRAVALALLSRGCIVYELSRHDRGVPGAVHIDADVTEESTVVRAFETIADRSGRIDILINCAGFGISGAAEFTPAAEARRQLDVNLLGTMTVIQAALPYMRRQGGGRIVNISSVAGVIPIPFQSWYSVSKAGINALTLALINELRPFGISLCAVMPGDICTGFTAARVKNPAGDDVYAGRIARSVAVMEADERNGASPATAGRAIAALALKRRVRPLYTLGAKYQLFVWLARTLPAKPVTALVGRIYDPPRPAASPDGTK